MLALQFKSIRKLIIYYCHWQFVIIHQCSYLKHASKVSFPKIQLDCWQTILYIILYFLFFYPTLTQLLLLKKPKTCSIKVRSQISKLHTFSIVLFQPGFCCVSVLLINCLFNFVVTLDYLEDTLVHLSGLVIIPVTVACSMVVLEV